MAVSLALSPRDGPPSLTVTYEPVNEWPSLGLPWSRAR